MVVINTFEVTADRELRQRNQPVFATEPYQKEMATVHAMDTETPQLHQKRWWNSTSEPKPSKHHRQSLLLAAKLLRCSDRAIEQVVRNPVAI